MREKHGPMVGWIRTAIGFGLSFLDVPPDAVLLPPGERLLFAEPDGGVAIEKALSINK